MFKKWLAILVAVLAIPISGYAQQEATLQGVITDTSGGVLPGVTITVVHVASGNTVTGVTDEKGEYRFPIRTGTNRVTAELSGFTTQTRTIDVLVGQAGVVSLQLPAGGVAETITVTGAAPLVDTADAQVGGNIDPKQLENIPVQGRNYMDLTLLAPGSRANATGDTPGVAFGSFQLNVDGQQVTQNCCSGAGGQPRFGQDAIAEFQYVSQFDATGGRSAGVQVNVISKSGTNDAAGSAGGYFRDDSLIAPDPIAMKTLPYSNQELTGTWGGPIVKDKAHYFVNYEYEREAQTSLYNSTAAGESYFDGDLQGTRVEQKGDTRLDFQLPAQTHLMVRGNFWNNQLPLDPAFNAPGTTVGALGSTQTHRYSNQVNVDLLKVIGSKAVNEFKGGYSGQYWNSNSNIPDWTGGPNTFAGPTLPNSGVPAMTFTGYTLGTPSNIPQRIGQDVFNLRDDYSFSRELHGRMDFKIGGEYQYYKVWHDWCNGLNGTYSFTGAPPANIGSFFPDTNNPATWNLVGLATEDPPTQYKAEIGGCTFNSPREIGAAWAQDDWQVSSRLTLNLGFRWDGETGTFANEIAIPPFLAANRPNPLFNPGPRLGMTYKLNDKTVLRAGWGEYYSETINQTAHNTRIDAQQYQVIFTNTAKSPTFIVDPYGPVGTPQPSFTAAGASFCSTQNVIAGCVLRSFASSMVSPYQKVPHSWQASGGIQRQFGDTIGIDSTFTWTGLRDDRIAGGTVANTNLIFNQNSAIGMVNTPYSAAVTAAGAATRAFPEFGVVTVDDPNGYSNFYGWQNQFNKRFSNRWQFQATYMLSYWYYAQAQAISGVNEVPFALNDAQGYQYGPAAGDQRHRITASGIYSLPWGFQLSGLYFFGSGQHFAVNCGADYLGTNGAVGGSQTSNRYCSGAAFANASSLASFESGANTTTGGILGLNSLVGNPIHRVDMRLSRNFKITKRVTLDGRLDLFNVFNHENEGTYTVNVQSTQFGTPVQTPVASAGTVYNPRTLQLGFRATF